MFAACFESIGSYPDFTAGMYSRDNITLKLLEQTGHFICENRYCISNNSLCDGVNDCYDGSDEGSICAGMHNPYAHYFQKICLCNYTLLHLVTKTANVYSITYRQIQTVSIKHFSHVWLFCFIHNIHDMVGGE